MKRIALIVLMSLVCIILSFHVVAAKKDLHEVTQNYERSFSSLRTLDEGKAAEWIYRNSSRIDHEGIDLIVKEAFKYKHPILILAIIHAESEFNLTVVSSADAIGLGQIRWSVWGPSLIKHGIAKEKRDLYNPKVNIAAISHILEFYLEAKEGNIPKALEGYLGGPSKLYTDKIAYSFMNLSMVRG